ncbi:MAG: prolyl aminopeptidase [Chromatiales bacterium]|nr:prolyl aminopeptidase [Chromatiales bacterium]
MPYPPIEPYEHGMLAVTGPHRVYWEQAGNPSGLPVLFLHGGPGVGASAADRRLFDPRRYRIVLMDQRGCGRSTPHASIEHNTTWDLVEDLERLRTHLAIDRWVVLGGSWGSALATAYAERHPEAVLGLVLRGVFLMRRQEVDWFYREGANALFPDLWEEFVAPIPARERDDLVGAYYRRLTDADGGVRLAAAHAWCRWEASTISMRGPFGHGSDRFVEAAARIEAHYFLHGGFLERDTQLLDDAHRLADIPGVIVQGRYDVCTPMRSAWALHRAWPASRLDVIPDAGHASSEPGILEALLRATDQLADRLT